MSSDPAALPAAKPSRRKTGPKKDTRSVVTFRVEDDVYEKLEAFQRDNGLRIEANAALIMHLFIRDPRNALTRFEAALGRVLEESHAEQKPEQTRPLRSVGETG